jgi:hypothetical protein
MPAALQAYLTIYTALQAYLTIYKRYIDDRIGIWTGTDLAGTLFTIWMAKTRA